MVVTHEDTDEVLLFNTSSGALVALDACYGGAVQALFDGEVAPEQAPAGLLGPLVEQGFMVEDSFDEVAAVVARNDLGITDPNRLDVFILPNMNCNFACPYCFEDHRPSQMSDETVDRLLRWFAATAPRFKVVLVSWFGGEPMLSFDRMIEVQRALRQICDAAGTKLNAHITTNGYLLNEKRARALCEAGVLSYQITMDGPPDIHNERRLLKGPGDSFERVFANLCTLATTQPRANIKLRVNFDPSTLPRIPQLLERFPVEVRPRLHLVLERIFGGEKLLYIGRSGDDVARRTENVYDLARTMGFAVTATPLEPGKLTYCYADRVSEFVFNHTGDVFKCTVSNFTPAERLGFLDDSGHVVWEGSRVDDWMALPAFDDKCFSCTYLPMCMGGCRKSREQSGVVGDDCTLPFAGLDSRVRHRYRTEVLDQSDQPLLTT